MRSVPLPCLLFPRRRRVIAPSRLPCDFPPRPELAKTCPQFVGLCRGLGLQARYVACLDPVPPHPRPPGSSKQTRANTVDLVAEEMEMERRRQRQRQRHRGGSWGCGQGRVRLTGARSWAEVLCKDGKDLVSRHPGDRTRRAAPQCSVLWYGETPGMCL